MSMMVNRFGDVVNNVNLINKRVDDAITLKRKLLIFTITGWLTAISFVIVALLK